MIVNEAIVTDVRGAILDGLHVVYWERASVSARCEGRWRGLVPDRTFGVLLQIQLAPIIASFSVCMDAISWGDGVDPHEDK